MIALTLVEHFPDVAGTRDLSLMRTVMLGAAAHRRERPNADKFNYGVRAGDGVVRRRAVVKQEIDQAKYFQRYRSRHFADADLGPRG